MDKEKDGERDGGLPEMEAAAAADGFSSSGVQTPQTAARGWSDRELWRPRDFSV